MKIELKGVGKRFRQEWVLRELSGSFEQPGRYAVTGPNGSGKSTLLRLLSGHLTPSKGQVSFFENEQKLNPEQVYAHISYAAPYIELIEEFTLAEALDFHRKFRPFLPGLGTKELIARLGFQKSAAKEIRHFSSGMKQRLKLLLAICSASSVLLLDEPGTNLDRQGMDWYHGLIADFAGDRLLIVASNVPEDYAFCKAYLDVREWKKG
ncbi:MAG: ATP-binding cassette domain-containing protein [Haliscomenobacter sp.]